MSRFRATVPLTWSARGYTLAVGEHQLEEVPDFARKRVGQLIDAGVFQVMKTTPPVPIVEPDPPPAAEAVEAPAANVSEPFAFDEAADLPVEPAPALDVEADTSAEPSRRRGRRRIDT